MGPKDLLPKQYNLCPLQKSIIVLNPGAS